MLVLVKNNSVKNCAKVHRSRFFYQYCKRMLSCWGDQWGFIQGQEFSECNWPQSCCWVSWLTKVRNEFVRSPEVGHTGTKQRAHEAQLLKCSKSGLPLRWLWRLTHCFFSVDSAHFQGYFWKIGRWKCHRSIEKIWRATAIRAAFPHVWESKRLEWLWQHRPG